MSDPIEILERRLKSTLTQQQDPRGLHFFCQVGGSYDALGIVTLQISGNGRALLSWRQEDDSDLWSLQLDPSDMLKFHGLLLANPFWSVTPARRPRQGEEINVHLRVSDQVAGTYNGIQFWTNDLDAYPVLRQLMTRLSRLMRTLSEDVISFDELEKIRA
ncbi:MAG: hypothetical protein H0U74_16245 [Bradymonadaceae bacterium]|nr:hypothetical protein [Lujinxingiaceae bacterium]